MRIVIERDLPLRTRDGVELLADLYRPDTRDRLPTLLHRTPYGKKAQLAGGSLDGLRLVEAGFNLVVQDVRGRFASGGEFTPFAHEAEDGADTVTWIGSQPWATGAVGMVGRSYGGLTQWLAATAPGSGEGLVAIAPDVTTTSLYDGWAYRGGAFQLGFALHWALSDLAAPEPGSALAREVAQELDGIDVLYAEPWRALPLLDELVPAYRTWLEHPTLDGYWSAFAPGDRLASMRAPALCVGGWYDVFVAGTIADYVRTTGDGGGASRLLVGPWAHVLRDEVYPQRSYGHLAGSEAVDLTGLHRRWFDAAVAGAAADGAAVRVFVMGADEWREFDRWPPATADDLRLYLHSHGRAGTAGGVLSPEPPGDERPDVFVYDPRSPVPTAGGATSMRGMSVGADCGPLDQRAVERRADVLCYSGAPLDAPLAVVGDVVLTLFAASSAVDTDFTAKLVDVWPSGRAEILCDGIVRARYRDSLAAPDLLVPDRIYRYSVEVGPIANVFRPGHRVRLEVSSSNFPRFDPNTNTGGPSLAVERRPTVQATNVVHHDRARPSHLTLRTIPWPGGA